MSNIDKRALREAAEKALPAMQRLLMMPNDELFDEALLNVDGDVDAANAFNLLTEPETMLALLDELEKEKGYASAYEGEKWHYHQLAESEGERANRAEAKLEAAEKRIAELEAREVAVKQFDDFQIVHYGGSEDYAKGYIDRQNNYNKALAAAGIGVKGE